MDDIYIEPDPGEHAEIEIEDLNDTVFSAFNSGNPIIIGEVKVKVLKYETLKPLGYNSGHRARVVVRRI